MFLLRSAVKSGEFYTPRAVTAFMAKTGRDRNRIREKWLTECNLHTSFKTSDALLTKLKKELRWCPDPRPSDGVEGPVPPGLAENPIGGKSRWNSTLQRASAIPLPTLGKQKPLPPFNPAEVPFEISKGWKWCRIEAITLHNLNTRH